MIKLRERVLGPDHPDVFKSFYNLALCLKAQDKIKEATEFARRSAEVARKVFPADHPERKKCEKLHQELTAKK